jgi:hypothetical protein
MPGLVPGIHAFLSCRWKDVDGRDKPGHDAERWRSYQSLRLGSKFFFSPFQQSG